MEYMEGGELHDPKNLHRCQTESQISQIVLSITDALAFCHGRDIVHRDIKVRVPNPAREHPVDNQ